MQFFEGHERPSKRLRVNWDLTKNISELYGPSGYIRTTYTYSPYGAVSANGDITQPIQWSSEFVDINTGLIYYNFRYYNSLDGKWICRDSFEQNLNLYCYCNNNVHLYDYLGLFFFEIKHIWKFYGLNGTYGRIQISTSDEVINGECGLPLNFITIEPAQGRQEHKLMKAADYTEVRSFRAENTPKGETGRTCPLSALEIQDPNYVESVKSRCDCSNEDWEKGINNELHVQGGINIHSGSTPSHIYGCILIETYYVPYKIVDSDDKKGNYDRS